MTNLNHPIENLMGTTMENLRDMIDVNTVVGDAVETKDGSYIIPISKVSFGFASGGSEIPNKELEKQENRFAFGGGSGAGVSVKPVAFLVLKGDSVRLLPVNQTNTYDRIVDSIPQIIEIFKDINYKKSDLKKESCDCD
ncbi:sporulation protein YtfJ [Clostridium perfringens]|nr:sporulation protein YtfJ [Clostridium perfringens]